LPTPLSHGALEIEMRGMRTDGVQTGEESKAAWLSMYDGRGATEPASYDAHFKANFFRVNVGWNFHHGKFQTTVSAAAPTPERLAATAARFGPKFSDRDFSREPLTPPISWDPARWYRLRYEWQGGLHRLLVDGTEVWRLHCPYPYAPLDHRLRVGGAPGRVEKFHNQIPGLTFRNLRVLSLPAIPVRPLADHPALKTGSNATRFLDRHRAFIARGRESPIGLLFLGDSITEGWSEHPEIWRESFGSHAPANFGIGGDSTQHVLWRILNGELEGLNPKAVILLIGTNNTGQHSAEEIAAGIRRILHHLLDRLPETRVLVLAVFPRGPRRTSNGGWDDGVHRAAVVRDLNRRLAAMVQGSAAPSAGKEHDLFFDGLVSRIRQGDRVRYLDLTPRLAGADGTPRPEYFRDNLHLNAAGYRVWAESLRSTLDDWLD
jgi:lysophospholipase L1-like esterase